MARRQFRSEHGLVWDVWDVIPSDVPGRSTYDRRADSRPGDPLNVPPSRTYLDAELEAGWLCFQCGTERRRFAPIPIGWFELPDGVLRVMLDIASPVNASPKTESSQP